MDRKRIGSDVDVVEGSPMTKRLTEMVSCSG
jgi:hypothetical protein